MDVAGHFTCRRLRYARALLVPTVLAMLTTGMPPLTSIGQAQIAPVGAGFVLDAGDLRFIYHQIEIAQAHAAGGQLFGPGANQVNEVRLPFGLRTVDGSFNHLNPDQTDFGAADELFPRLTTPDFRAAEAGTSYEQRNGQVTDSQPRIISNLIVDQTSANPAAVIAAGPSPEIVDVNGNDIGDPFEPFFIPNVAPDVGLSAPFNQMFTFFGQFFDHGLDLVNKGGNGTVFVPLAEDDPLRTVGPDGLPNTNDEVPDHLAFMVLTRATNLPGPDGRLGTDDDIQEGTNQTTPFVDQNQTYTSHPSHQVFLRQYTLNAQGRPVSTGRMIDGSGGHIGNWGEVKAQARTMLGIQLVDRDVFNVPLLLTDPYGRFIPAANGFPQIVTSLSPLTTVAGNPAANGGLGVLVPQNAPRTGHAFLDDIAHAANPSFSGYDPTLLNDHFVTGDGRGNENIALTAVHTIFHSEHNRLANEIGYGSPGVPALIDSLLTPAEAARWRALDTASGWDFGERIFQAARFVTEMQYQHLVFEEFARKLVPSINEFIGDGINFQSDTNPAIFAEFAHQTYRLGHSMLTETISRMRTNGTSYDISLVDGFLNPREFMRDPLLAAGTRLTAAQAAGAIFQGGTRQVGNEIDEFVTDAVRNNLLGLPLDLAVFNLSRGRSEGIAPLNKVRAQLHLATGDAALAPYRDWFDFYLALKHPESLGNFIAGYGLHPSLVGPDRTRGTVDDPVLSLEERRSRGQAIVDAMDAFLFESAATSGVDDIDLWIGGLAEKIAPFGSMLGSTFNSIFELQLENLQNADRFYYLERLDGLNLLNQMENNSFSALIMRNVDAVGLAGEVFARPDLVINIANIGPPGGPFQDDPTTPGFDEALDLQGELLWQPDGTNPDGTTRFKLRYIGASHAIFNGTPNGDRIHSSEGDDTLRGDDGNDVMEGGSGNDSHIGGAGDDILTDVFGEDNIKGGPGNDAISSGAGPFDLVLGNEGHDFIVGGNDVTESFGGPGNDVIYSGDGATEMFGGAGDDWIEGGPQLDLLVGDENNQFQDDPNQGHDVITGGKGDDDYDSEGGDDIMVADVLGTERLEGMLGFDWVTYRGDPLPVDTDMNIRVVLPPNLDELRDRFDLAEALSGWNQNDILRGEDSTAAELGADSNLDGIPDHGLTAAGIARIQGLGPLLNTFLGSAVTQFVAGNIILGGLGSDLIEGRGGDDIIDGDLWLNVQLGVLNLATPDANDFSRQVDSLHALKSDVFSSALNPGNIRIVRAIVNSGSAGSDVALFSGPVGNYTITGPDAAGIVTVVDNVGLDGTDRLRNIETLRFPNGDGTFTDRSTGNNAPTGAPVLSQTLPQEGEQLSVANGTIADADGITAGTFGWLWQQAPAASSAWVNIAGATAQTFTPAQAQVGQTIRAIVSFNDGGGRRESVPSAASGVVGDLFVGTAANEIFNGTAGRDRAEGAGGDDTLNTLGADDVVLGQGGNDTLNTGAGDDTVAGGPGDDVVNAGDGNDVIRFNAAEGFDAVNGGAGVDEVRAVGADATIGLSSLAAVESITAPADGVDIVGSEAANTLNFSAVTLTNINRIIGAGGADVITGSAVADRIDGGAGGDSINGGAAGDELNGEFGADTINGEGGGDTISGGPGNDTLAGGAGADTINGNADNDDITGGAGSDTLNPGATLGNDVFRFAAGFDNDTINGFGATQDAATGQDLLNVTALGISAANFATRVTIVASGANTVITVRNANNTVAGTITLNGVAAGTVSQGDFVLAP